MNDRQKIARLTTQLFNCKLVGEGRDVGANPKDYGWSEAYAAVRECNIQRAMWHRMYNGMVDKLDKAKADLKAARELVNAMELVSDER